MYSQHEKASVDMFSHLITENNLDSSLISHGIHRVDRTFIKELIAGPDSGKVSNLILFLEHRWTLCID